MKQYRCVKACIMHKPFFDSPRMITPEDVDGDNRPMVYAFAEEPPKGPGGVALFVEVGKPTPPPQAEPGMSDEELRKLEKEMEQQAAEKDNQIAELKAQLKERDELINDLGVRLDALEKAAAQSKEPTAQSTKAGNSTQQKKDEKPKSGQAKG